MPSIRSALLRVLLSTVALGGCGEGGDGGATGGAPAPDAGAGGRLGKDAAQEWDARPAPPEDAEVDRDRRISRPRDARVEPDALVGGGCDDALDLNALAAASDGAWTFVGDSSEAPGVQFGSCGGNGREVAFLFTAPETGEYRFSTVSDDEDLPAFDTILHARRTCAEPATEVACDNDPTRIQALISVSLTADEAVSVLVDAFALGQGGDFSLRVMLRRPAGDGELCEPADGNTACGENLRCVTVEGRSFCRRLTAPVLEEGALAYNPDVRAVGVRVVGVDPESDVQTAALTLLDASGEVVPLGPGSGPHTVEFETLTQADGAFSGWVSLVVPDGLPDISRATVAVTDSTGLTSAPLDLQAAPPTARAEGEPCDAARAFTVCSDGHLCDDSACAAPVRACPPGFGARDLALDVVADGDLAAFRDVARGRCGGSIGDAVFEFTAESAGLHVFEARGDHGRAAPVLLARTHCGVEDVAAGLGCAPPGRGGVARLVLDLDAGQVVYLFLDSADPTWTGPFHLRGWQPAPPTLAVATVFANPEASMLGFSLEGGDPDEDVQAFSVRLLDRAGEDLLGLGEAVDLRLAANELTSPQRGRVEVRAARFLDLDVRDVARVQVSLKDAVGGRSVVRSVVPVATPTVRRGEACDLDQAFALCGPDDHCAPEGLGGPGDTGTCEEVSVECPPEYGLVVDLSDPAFVQPDGRWRFDGDTFFGFSATAGTCGGDNAPDAVHRFVAPAAGRYRFFTTVEPGRETVLYLRTHCGEADPIRELGCSDDAVGEAASAVEVDLAAREIVHALVDGLSDGFNGGPYTLWVEAM